MPTSLSCACVIHGSRYDWRYVDHLNSMLRRNLNVPVDLHVFTEANRSVPSHMIKHNLVEWPEVSGTKRAWWYKMQMFDPRHGLGRMLYLDLDVVIADRLDWVVALPPEYFWAIHDWRRLWRPHWRGINSSMMLWQPHHAQTIWQRFQTLGLPLCVRNYHGDQDFIAETIPEQDRRYFHHDLVRSWRWEIRDGGMDPKTRRYARPGAGSVLRPGTAVMVFHGSPKPHETQDSVVQQLWQGGQS